MSFKHSSASAFLPFKATSTPRIVIYFKGIKLSTITSSEYVDLNQTIAQGIFDNEIPGHMKGAGEIEWWSGIPGACPMVFQVKRV